MGTRLSALSTLSVVEGEQNTLSVRDSVWVSLRWRRWASFLSLAALMMSARSPEVIACGHSLAIGGHR